MRIYANKTQDSTIAIFIRDDREVSCATVHDELQSDNGRRMHAATRRIAAAVAAYISAALCPLSCFLIQCTCSCMHLVHDCNWTNSRLSDLTSFSLIAHHMLDETIVPI